MYPLVDPRNKLKRILFQVELFPNRNLGSLPNQDSGTLLECAIHSDIGREFRRRYIQLNHINCIGIQLGGKRSLCTQFLKKTRPRLIATETCNPNLNGTFRRTNEQLPPLISNCQISHLIFCRVLSLRFWKVGLICIGFIHLDKRIAMDNTGLNLPFPLLESPKTDGIPHFGHVISDNGFLSLEWREGVCVALLASTLPYPLQLSPSIDRRLDRRSYTASLCDTPANYHSHYQTAN